TLRWASNREPDLAEYRIYRAESAEATRDLRLMTLVHTSPLAVVDPAARAAEMVWTDTPVQALFNFYYRVVAVDTSGNVSEPCGAVMGRAFDELLPEVPPLSVEWAEGDPPVARAEWMATNESRLERRAITNAVWDPLTPWLQPGSHTV